MKVNVSVTVVKNSDGSFSARFKSNFRPETDNLKNVDLKEIAKHFEEELEYAEEKEYISK
jgi:hypothetical protein